MAAQKRKKNQGPSFTGNGHLEQSPINLLSLREHARNQIKNILTRTQGRTKHLIWDGNLVGALNVIITPKLLSDNGITSRSNLEDSRAMIESDCDSIIYFTYPIVEHMKLISKQIKQHHKRGRNKNFYIYCLPRTTYLCEKTLDEEAVLGSVYFGELPIEWFPMDKDLLTCCLDNTFSSVLNGDLSNLFDIAKALVKLQAVFGKFPIVRAKGDFSCGVVDIMARLMHEDSDLYKFDENSQISEISQCIIIDRTVDMITPLLSPRTYEGLLDETIGIIHGLIKLDKQYLGKSQQKLRGGGASGNKQTPTSPSSSVSSSSGNEIPIVLNSSDNIFKQLRDINFRYLGPLLTTLLSAIQTGYDARHEARTTKELNNYMKRFKNLHADHQLVEQHVHLAEYISLNNVKKMNYKRKIEHEMLLMSGDSGSIVTSSEMGSAEDYLEELIGRNEPIEIVLRFMILISLCQGGISSKKYDGIKRDIIQGYGIKHLLTLDLLEQYQLITKYETMLKLLKGQTGYFNWARVRQNFQLYKPIEELHEMYKKNRALTQSETSGNTETDISGLVNDASCLGIYDLNLVGSGYAPLSARLVEAATRPHGWHAIENELELLPGKHYLEEKIISVKQAKSEKSQNNSGISGGGDGMGGNVNSGTMTVNNDRSSMYDEKTNEESSFFGNENKQSVTDMMQQQSTHKTVFIFFIGGVSYSEISAIRMLENRPNTPWKFIIGTTDIANGFKIVDGFVDQSFKDKSDNSIFNSQK